MWGENQLVSYLLQFSYFQIPSYPLTRELLLFYASSPVGVNLVLCGSVCPDRLFMWLAPIVPGNYACEWAERDVAINQK